MEITITLALWKATDKAQLERFMDKNKNRDIHIGELTYRITQGFLEEPNDLPMVELVAIPSRTCYWVRLGLIDPDYSNYSALDRASRLDLISDLGIEI